MHQKLVPDPSLMLVDNPKQPLHARNPSIKKIFLKGIYQKAFKKLTLFFLLNLAFLIDKIIKNKRSLELVTSCSLGYKTSDALPD